MRRALSGILLALTILAVALSSFASQILRKTLQEKARQSDLVLTGKVVEVRDTGLRDMKNQFDRWEAESAVVEVICGSETNRIVKVTFFLKPKAPLTSLPQGDRLEQGKTYILFLRHDGQTLSLLEPWDCSAEVSSQYGAWDEDYKDDQEMLKRSSSSINNVPSVTLSHETFLEKIRVAWQKRGTKSEQDGKANGSQPIRSATNSTSPATGSRR